MAISKCSLLANSSRFVILAVNSYEHGEVGGIFYHESIGHGISFESLMEAVAQMELLYDRTGYPARTMEYRQFVADEEMAEESDIEWAGEEGKPCGALATLRVCVRHRYNASWQGYAVWEEENRLLHFDSFLEFVRVLKQILGDGSPVSGPNNGPVCRVAVDEYRRRRMEGRVAYPSVAYDITFGSIIQLMEQMESMSAREGDMRAEDRTPLQFSGCYRGRGHLATFVIRLLFQENATWQGMIYWREARCQLSFRSYLELIRLMDAAVRDTAGGGRRAAQIRQIADI